MNKRNENIWLAAVVVFGACLISFAFHNIVLHPSRVLGDMVGDGAKNSFTYLYQSLYGHGYWFTGMNYPYGEHIVYTDGQPAISVPLSYFKNVSVGEALSVMWMLIALSYLLCLVFIYKILRHFGVTPLAAMLFAGLITVFSPQLFKLQGLYGLSYACFIPMLFYWTIKYDEQPRWRYLAYIYIMGCVSTFIHPYYLGMLLVWAFAYMVAGLIVREGRFVGWVRHVLPLVICATLVLGTVGAIMKTTDPITDRPTSPYNLFDAACTHINELTTSEYSPIWQNAEGKPRFHLVGRATEGYGYPGIVVLLVVAAAFIDWLFGRIKKKSQTAVAEGRLFSPIWLVMALVAMLISMGVPFIWHLQGLFDHFSFFRQFRCLGRFIWIFYYIVTVYAVVMLYRTFANYMARRKFIAGYGILVAALVVWGYEASGYIHFSRQLSGDGMAKYDFIFSKGTESWPAFLNSHNHSAGDFQAVLVLPFFEIGSEKLGLSDPTWLITVGSMASLQLHLPIVNAQMSRTSWSQAMKQVKIAGGPFTDKPLLRDIKSDKPFLLLHYERGPLDPDQQYLLQAADYIGHLGLCQVYACYPARVAANDKMYADSVAYILPLMQQTDTIIGEKATVFIDHFDKKPDNNHLFGNGGYPVVPNDSSVIATIPMAETGKDSTLYEFSCWFLESDKDFRMGRMTLQLLDGSGKITATEDARADQSTDNNGMWFRAASHFYVPGSVKAIRCILDNRNEHACLGLDELLLRPAGAMVISRAGDGRVMVNDHIRHP